MKITIYSEGKPHKGHRFSLPYTVITDSFLDEELDVCPIEIKHIQKSEPFPRFSIASLLEDESEEPEYWMIASDNVQTNTGTGYSNHVLRLVEPTKWLERFIVGNKTVTQPIFSDYLTSSETVVPLTPKTEYPIFSCAKLLSIFSYKTPFSNAEKFPIYPPYCFDKVADRVDAGVGNFGTTGIDLECKIVNMDTGGTYLFSKRYEKKQDVSAPTEWSNTNPIEYVTLGIGTFTITYSIIITHHYDGLKDRFVGEYSVAVVAPKSDNPRTLKDAAMSMICAAETLKGNEGQPVPRFTLNAEIAAELEKITSPELTVTGATLREALDEIGKCIGAVTVLEIKPSDYGGRFIYEINFEKYCKETSADTSELGTPCDIYSAASCEDYCTALDATVDNLVQYAEGGSIYDPSPQLWRTPRSEDASYRLTEDSAEIFTAFPIERIDGLTCRIYDDFGEHGGVVDLDLKKYLFEASEYAALSSFSSVYPYTKAYALCYTLGQRNITGLNFLLPHAVSQIFQTAALVNIVNKELAANGIDKSYDLFSELDFTKILFRVKYVPTGAARVRMRKPSSYGMTESVLAFNQSSAKLDATAFGRSMFGNVLRMGNKQMTYVYKAPLGAKVPKKGERFGENGYVSEIREEFAPEQKTVTITVSDGFNRISQFVGVNKAQRLFEISERMSLDRHIVYEDRCLISTEKREGLSGSILTGDFIYYLRDAFLSISKEDKQKLQLFAVTTGYDEGGNALASCLLSCIPYGIGNALTFTVSFADNYGAGRRIASERTAFASNESGEKASYYAAEEDVRYTDFFGRVAELELAIEDGIDEGHMPNVSNMGISIGQTLPAIASDVKDITSPIVKANGANRIYVDKDSREAIKTLTYQISFLEADGIKISPHFAEKLPYVGCYDRFAIILTNGNINNLTEWVRLDKDSSYMPINGFPDEDYPTALEREVLPVKFTVKKDADGWAVVDNNETREENGEKYLRFLFGKNGHVSEGEAITVYFNFFH